MFDLLSGIGLKIDRLDTKLGKPGSSADNTAKIRRRDSQLKSRRSHQRSKPSNGGDLGDREIEELHSDIASAIQPLRHLVMTDSKNQELFLKYFTLIVILLPSIFAVIIPTSSGDIDIASIATDGLMIVLVSWFIKFTIEWPWSWMRQIRDTRLKLINHINSTILNNRSSMASDLQLNQEVLINNILLIKKLNKLELYSILLSFLGSLFGSALMLWARNYMIIEESRKKIVFNNLNICIFMFWGVLRLVLALSEVLQKTTVDGINENFNSKNDPALEYGLVTEHNLDTFLQPKSEIQRDGEKNTHHGLEKAALLTPFELLESDGDIVNKEKQKELASYETKISLLEKSALKQKDALDLLATCQDAEFKKINLILNKLEDTVTSIKDVKLPSSSNGKGSIYLKPFPLNFVNVDRKSKALFAPPVHEIPTIFEEDVEDEEEGKITKANIGKDQPAILSARLPRMIFEESSGIDQATTKDATSSDSNEMPSNFSQHVSGGHFSLHGLPFQSSIKDLITRQLCQEGIEADVRFNDLVGYESETNSSNMFEDLQSEVALDDSFYSFLKTTKIILRRLKKKTSITDLIKNPFIIKNVLRNELVPVLDRFIRDNVEKYSASIILTKLIIWEIFSRYVFNNINILMTYFSDLHKHYFGPLKKFEKLLFLICMKIPLNILRFQLSVALFFPKLLVNIFVIYPFLRIKNRWSRDNHEKKDGSKPSSGIKEFHLNSSASGMNHVHRIGPNTRTRKRILDKLSKYYDLDSDASPLDVPTVTPVILHDEE
ncbi:uncharacterized protein PRCAT00004372001 [Priceomyces carsonii]|uniref:uncharacterized protein n=1 Tax=Priceomyces carsonii TaxID=28549 RepID=UPI002ED9E799|nr:unnamed protein product [Priceomyces carsonii]